MVEQLSHTLDVAGHFESDRPLRQQLEALGAAVWRFLRSTSRTELLLAQEFDLFLMRRPRERAKYARAVRAEVDALAATLERSAVARGEPLPIAAALLARTIDAVAHGLLHSFMLDPRRVDEQWCVTAFAALAHRPPVEDDDISPGGRRAGLSNSTTMGCDSETLQAWVAESAERLAVPGVSVGVYHDGAEHRAVWGVTSVENPLPVDDDTLFQFGSTGKTFTATAIMRLVAEGRVALDATVRTYLPELRLQDESVARDVTVLQLLNHTAGWAGDVFDSTGDGDDALARYVEKMADVDQVTPLGASVSYNNASLSVAGRVIERVTGTTFERAIAQLIFEPLGLEHCFFFPNDIMTRRFVAGHNQHADGTISVTRPWALARNANPAGGISSNAGDLISWARFHLGDGRGPDGREVLPEELLRRMQQPTVETPGSALGDAVGISWMLRDVEGVRMVSHGGDTLGQHSSFAMVPEHRFAVTGLTNCGPNGNQFLDELGRWALEAYLGIVERDPEPLALSADELAGYAGTYETIAATARIVVDGGGLALTATIKPETLAKLVAAGDEPPDDSPPFPIGILPGPGDRYIVTDGPAKGMKGYFVRTPDGAVESVHVGGRLATRVTEATDDAR